MKAVRRRRSRGRVTAGRAPETFTDGARPTYVRLLSGLSRVRERADVLRARGRAEATMYDEDVVRLGL